MSERISDEKLAEWEARAKAATPGEWIYDETNTPFYNDPEGRSCGGEATGFAEVVQDGDIDTIILERVRLRDAAHIAFNNPSFALSAIAEIHRLRGERDEAVRHLRAMSHVAPRAHEVEEACAFLAKLEERG